ncbi:MULTISPECIES: hypothetical protein [unclassified Streptomyces]|uniref:hypothetical protein n=1 Tax=Streptomyces TaxID=1883 RepID=UPI0028D18184|nr:hypothetical protein [Streptomyces sp. DSM 40907]
MLPSDTAHAAGLVTGTFLPAYEQAVHERLLAAVEAAHGRLEELHTAWTAIQHSGRYSDGTRLDPAMLGHTQQRYLEEGSVEWRRLRPHAAALLSRVRPVAGAEDSASLDRLHQLLHPDSASSKWPAPASSHAALPPGTAEPLRRWRTDAPALLRQARATRPVGPATAVRPAIPAVGKAPPSALGRAPRSR